MNPQQPPNNVQPQQANPGDMHIPQGVSGQTAAQQPPQPQASNPLQPFYMQNPPMGQATLFQGAQLDPNIMNALSPNSVIQQILQGFAPQAQQANRNLNDTLAASGIAGGPAAGLQEQLQSQLASGLAPTIASAIQGAQGNQLQAALANAGFTQQAGLSNQGASNEMTAMNIGNLMQQLGMNTQLANNSQDQIAQALLNAYGMNFNAFNNLNDAGLQGVQNLSATNLGSAGNLANSEANNFPIYQSMWPSLFSAGAAFFGG